MNILDKEKAITLICEYIKSKNDIEHISKVNSNAFCNNVFNTHYGINEFGNYYIIKCNDTYLNKVQISKDYLSFTNNNVAYKLNIELDFDSSIPIDKTIDINVKFFGFSKINTIKYQVLMPKKNYILSIGHYTFNIDEEEYNFIMKTYDDVIQLHNKEKEANKLLNLQKNNDDSISKLLKQFNI